MSDMISTPAKKRSWATIFAGMVVIAYDISKGSLLLDDPERNENSLWELRMFLIPPLMVCFLIPMIGLVLFSTEYRREPR